MDQTKTFKKLVVFDTNLDWKIYSPEDPRYRDINLLLALFKQAYEHQTIVITTSGSLNDALAFMARANFERGFLVASGGGVIYDFSKKKIILKNVMDKDEIRAVIHHGIMFGLNIAIQTINHKYLIVSNTVAYEKIKDKVFSPFIIINNHSDLNIIIEAEEIVDVSFVNLVEASKNSKERSMLFHLDCYFENEINNLVTKANKTSIFTHIGNKASTKYKAVQTIMDLNGIENPNDVLYVGGTCINKQCYITFRNTLITSNPDFIYEIGNCKRHRYLAQEINNLDPELGLRTNSFWK